jgi:GNAT superfamily N-acetyltransferase
MSVELVERVPTVGEYQRLIAAIGWKPRDEAAISSALAGSLFSICARLDGNVVSMGRVIGDGGLHYYLTDVVVLPAHQRRGIGASIVRALNGYLERVPFKNSWVGVFAVEGTVDFYARLGFKAQNPSGPAMFRWWNKSAT